MGKSREPVSESLPTRYCQLASRNPSMNRLSLPRLTAFGVLVLACVSLSGFHLATFAEDTPEDIVAPGATVVQLADGFAFTEGPACDAEGNVLFTDQPNDRILKWSVDGKLSTFMQPSGRSNGLCFDAEGHLGLCGREERVVVH